MKSTRLLARAAGIMMVLSACSVFASDEGEDHKFLVLQPGYVDAADLDSAIPVTGWFALVSKGERWELVGASVSGGDSEIVSPDQPDALVLLRGKGLAQGAVEASQVDFSGADLNIASYDMGSGSSGDIPHRLGISFHSRHYELAFNSMSAPNNPGRLVLNQGHSSTVLDGQDSDDTRLQWAGDIDHDGKLDLILETDHDGGKNATLCVYLSSAGNEHFLVKEVGCQFYSG